MTPEQLAEALDYFHGPEQDHSSRAAQLAATELRRLAAIEAAAKKLVAAKGRYHTEQNYRALEALMKETP